MNKIWIVINNGSYRNQKHKVYKSETQLLKAISADKNQEILEYNLTSKITTESFFKERDRDTQLRSILGELDVKEESAMDLISFYEKNAPNGKVIKNGYGNYATETNTKEIMIKLLRKYQHDKKAFAGVLVKQKRYFTTVLTDVEWYKILLKCHGFTNPCSDKSRYDRTLRKYVTVDTTTQEIKDNFLEAKKQLRKKK